MNPPRINKRSRSRSQDGAVPAAGQGSAEISKTPTPERKAPCQRCRAGKKKCEAQGPACTRCLRLGMDCVKSSGHPKREASVRIEDLLRTNKATVKMEGVQLESEVPMKTEDEPNGTVNNTTDKEAPQLQYVGDGRHNCRSLQIDSAKVFDWPVFAHLFGPQAKAMIVLRHKHPRRVQPPVSALDSFLGGPFVGDMLVGNFIRNVHIRNPILELASLERRALDIWTGGIECNPESCLMLLVWALGAIATPFASTMECDAEHRELGAALFGIAAKRLGATMAEGGIVPAQCFFYAGVYLSFEFQPVSAWRHFLQALAYCQEFDVAIQGAREPQAPTTALQRPSAKLNLYWSCWKAEGDLRSCLGLFDFQTQDRVYPESPPAFAVNAYMEGRFSIFYLAEISLLEMATSARNDIGQILSSFSGDNDGKLEALLKQTVKSYDNQGKNWRAALPQAVAFDMNTSFSEFDVYQFTLGCRLLDFEELVSWTFLEDAINSGGGSLPRHVFHYAGQGILACMNRIRMAEIGHNHRSEGTWMLLQSCARSVIVLMAASLSHHAQTLLPQDWICFVDAGIRVLRRWGGEDAGIQNQVLALEELRGLHDLRTELGC
ncbi:hypothetical protein J3F83DRAFT_639895 [Trichoderma novae-zelandiae]